MKTVSDDIPKEIKQLTMRRNTTDAFVIISKMSTESKEKNFQK